MALGSLPDRSNIRYDKMPLGPRNPENYNRPMIVKVVELREDFTSQQYPNPKDVVFVDVVDLMGPANDWNPGLLVGVLWGGASVVDTLRNSVGEAFPVKAVHVAQGRGYPRLVMLEGAELEFAMAYDAKFPTALDDERNKRMAEAEAARMQPGVPSGPVTPQAPSAPPLTPMGQAAPAAPAPVPAGPVPAGMPAQPFAPQAVPAPAAQGQPSGPAPVDVQAALADLNAPKAQTA